MTASPPLERLSTALADRYRLERELGQGGMATVYLAEDVRHRRKVAIKVLHPELSALLGPDRFLKEIELTAALQHPHILPLFDSGAAQGLLYYVMPFVEGETLRSRLAREHQLPVPEALRIAADVAGALEYAHKRGVIHRDIKPENILLHEGRPQVADFGIALAVQQAGGHRMTQTGMSLGTPQYMAPEQAMGDKGVDARADIYALGVVTYEMLTGEPPFTGPTSQAVFAKVMTEPPKPPVALRKTVPPHVNDAVLTALEKLPADRFPSTAEFVRALGDTAFTHTIHAAVASRSVGRRTGPGWVVIGGVAIAAALAGAGITWSLRKAPAGPAQLIQFTMPLPDSTTTALFGGGSPLLPTRDGRLLWTTGNGLYERALGGLTTRRLRDLEGASSAYLQDESPDGTQLLLIWNTGGAAGLASAANTFGARPSLVIAPAGNGPVRVLTDSADFAAWGADGLIYYTYYWPFGRVGGLARIPAQGGTVDTLTTFPVSATGDVPQNLTLLPKGRGVILSLGQRAAPLLAAFDLRSQRVIRLGPGGPSVSYVEPGYLLFTSGRSIMAAPFDLDRLAFRGPAQPLLEVSQPSVRFTAAGSLLVYRGSTSPAEAPPLVIAKRNGTSRPLPNVPAGYWLRDLAVSPDGRRFALVGGMLRAGASIGDVRDLYVYQLPSGPLSRVPVPQRPVAPAWLPGGAEVGFTKFGVDTPTTWSIMRTRWDGSAAATAVVTRPTVFGETSWLPNGKGVVVLYANSRGIAPGSRPKRPNTDIGLVSFDRLDSIQPLVTSPAYDGDPAVSPDGRFLAYRSDESGRAEVWVRPLMGGSRRQVSLQGGVYPRWAWSGRELFFFNAGRLFVAEIRTVPELSVGPITELFAVRNPSFMPAPLPGDSEFVAFGGLGEAQGADAPVVVLVGVQEALARLFAKERAKE
jgi:serine/threonine-protein kinase